MSFRSLAETLRAAPDGAIVNPPYAAFLGLRYSRGSGRLILTLPFAELLVGLPYPPRLHGGAVAGLLEITAIATLLDALGPDDTPSLKPVSVTIDYLRAGATQDVTAAAVITRLGKRVANIRAEAWQDAEAKPIAAAHMNVMLVR